jgi:phage protein U
MFAILGDIEFTVAGGISGMEWRSSADWAEHARIQGKALLEWVGESLDEYNLTIELHPLLGDPQARLRALRQAKSSHQPLALVMGNGDYLGPYVITDLSQATRRTTASGQVRAATLQVSLREYTGAFIRKTSRPGVLDPATSGTAKQTDVSPSLMSRLTPSPSTTQQVLGHAKTASNVIKAGQNVYDAVKSGNPSMILGQVPQLLGVTARAIEPLQGFKEMAGLLEDGADLSRLGDDVLGNVLGARSSLTPVDLGNIIDRFSSSHASLTHAMGKLDSAGSRLAGLAAQVLTRKA